MKIIKIFNAISEKGNQCFAIVEDEQASLFSRDLKKIAKEVRKRAYHYSNSKKKEEKVRICFPAQSEIYHHQHSVHILLFSLFEEQIRMFWRYYTGEKNKFNW